MQRLPILLLALLVAAPVLAEDWTEFRGPDGQGRYAGKGLPIEWSTTKNVAWKKAIPGHGWSSPIVLDGRIYLTTAAPVADGKNQSLRALCLDAADGTILWQSEVFLQNGAKAPPIHGDNSHASPSPLTDGKHLFVHFGHQGTACLDLNGKVIWRNIELGYTPVHGNGGSPIFVEDKLVFSADGGDKQFIAALDKSSGKIVWKTPRKTTYGKKFSFSTPLLITVGSKQQIVSPGSGGVMAYDPAEGKELWRVSYDGYSVIPRPVFGHGMVFISSSFNSAKLMAIRVDADASGDITKSHVSWTLAKGAPHTPSPLLVGDELYAVTDGGLASCIDARTGKVHWQERIAGNAAWASPLYADGKVYFQSKDGVTTVVKAGKTHEVLATSKLNERTFASYAVADGAIHLRTETLLYRLQAK